MASLADLRAHYGSGALDEADAPATPFVLFARWFEEALATALPEPNAMVLSTVDGAGQPSARVVLLKGVDEDGFLFFTNYHSRKGREMASDARVALTFWWPPLERQVRVEGRAEPVDAATSDAYFVTRPRGSQLGAVASPQSEVVGSRAELEARLTEVEARFAGQAVERPPHWGGYRVIPHMVEFWQGRPSRLHDRLRYTREDDHWRLERLAP
ncbi:MAG TPA: pyridoxamine 5'-phosphate oxidase [Rhodothermales bacterium]|nr:pyridoxamine 5'-phosphate oxidase [Rhodothermales bacterium]